MNFITTIWNHLRRNHKVAVADFELIQHSHPLEIAISLNWFGFLIKEYDTLINIEAYAKSHPEVNVIGMEESKPKEWNQLCEQFDKDCELQKGYYNHLWPIKEATVFDTMTKTASKVKSEYFLSKIINPSESSSFGNRAVDITPQCIHRLGGSVELGQQLEEIWRVFHCLEYRNRFIINPTTGPETYGPYADAMILVRAFRKNARKLWDSGELEDSFLSFEPENYLEEWQYKPKDNPTIDIESLEHFAPMEAAEYKLLGTIRGKRV